MNQVIRNSIVQARGAVTFPAFAAERHYMIEFNQRDGLPQHLSHWQQTVDQMLEGIKAPREIYLMVDQKEVCVGETHRRPGIHVDGYWDKGIQLHRGGGGGHRPIIAGEHDPGPVHVGGAEGWADALFDEPEAIILAADITSAIAYRGKWSGKVGDMGDCDHLDVSHLNPVVLSAGTVFAGNAAMLHESIPVMFDCQRTVVRLNVPGWTPQ